MKLKSIIYYLIIFLYKTLQLNCEITPIVITPKILDLNSKTNIVIISSKTETINVWLKHYKTHDLIANNTYDVIKDEPLIVPLEVKDFTSSSDIKAILSVISGSEVKSESLIKLIPKSGYAFIQTDKPIYTPKEDVLIRMLRLDDRLRPLNQKIKLRIKNSQKIIIEEKTLSPSAPNYFIDHRFEFPPSPKLGLWSAELWYGTNYSFNSNVSFEVKEYVLPTFSVTIKSPKFISESTSNITGSVRVDYVYGKAVNGSVQFKFGTKAPNGKVEYFGSTGIKTLLNGFSSYFIETQQYRTLPLVWFPGINGYRFVVEVSVHETATGKKDKVVDESGLFVTIPYVIDFKNTFTDFKPNAETFIEFKVKNVLGEPVPDMPVRVTMQDNEGNIVKHMLQKNNNYIELTSDHLGVVSFPITLEERVKHIRLSVQTNDPLLLRREQADQEHTLWLDESNSAFIFMKSRSKYVNSLTVGDTYQSPLQSRGLLSDRIYLIVVNRGHIIHSERISTERGIKLGITRDMTPSIRLLVLAVTQNQELVSDSFRIDVNEDKCGFDMSLQNNTKEVMPGKTVNLYLNGSIGDSVGLLGVDEAVFVLRNEDKLTKTKVFKELLKSDMGCGPGTSADIDLVVNNVGLKLLTPDSKVLDQKYDEMCLKRQSKRRNKRSIESILNHFTGFERKCCLLGAWPSNLHNNCAHKTQLLKEYMPGLLRCHSAFLQCCKALTRPTIQASTSFGVNPGIDRTRIGSETEEYVHIAYEQDLEDQSFVRKDFRESWLFDVVVLNHSSMLYPITPPHSITTWSITGMSISPTNGLCIMSSPLRLRTFQPVFAQISLPYSVVQNEQMEMIVTVFNYGTVRLTVLIYHYGIEGICSEADGVREKAKKSTVVEANSFSTIPYAMVPLKTGEFEIKTAVLWPSGGDVVIKKLRVVPPGVTVEEDLTFQLDPKNRQRRQKRSIKTSKIEDEIISENSLQKTVVHIEPDLTRNIVPGTRECIIAGIGDEFGATSYTTLSDIDRLIRQPKGCGEQTMLYMAPTLYTLNYLKSIERLNGDLRYRGLKYIREGYKRELSFRKDDGSYSAFPTRPSSIWLTAFVMRVLCQSSPYLKEDKFDPNVITSGLNWLMKLQLRDGSYLEKHAVVHELALGGIRGSVPLTAYLVIAFHECRRVIGDELKDSRDIENSLNKSISKAEKYLALNENELIKGKNTYAMALVAYSFTFTDPLKSHKLIDALHSMANTDDNRNFKYWRNDYEVEATAYALMAILNSGKRNSLDGLSISNWLNSVRSFSGSFAATQDTIVALEALSQYIDQQKTSTNSISLLCNISSHDMTASRFRRALEFNPENARILQTFKLESDSTQLKFTTTGEGMGHMLVKLKYNVFEPPEVLCRFDLNIDIKEWRAPAVRSGDDGIPDIDDNFFNEFDSNLVQRLDLKHKRQKRSFWDNYKFPNPFKRSQKRESQQSESTPTQSDQRHTRPRSRVQEAGALGPHRKASEQQVLARLNPKSDLDIEFKKNNLSSNSIANKDTKSKSKLVLVIETCIRHLPRYYSDMSLIEVGILSGYKPNKDDLEEILKVEDGLVSKYEISERNVVFYFEKVPFGRPYCIQFRIIQEHTVSNTQAALVKVYDYYKKDHSCTQLYTPSRFSEYIETKCTSDVCECAKRENCPNPKSLIEIGTIAVKRVQRARQLFEQLVCDPKFNYVFIGTIDKQNITQNGFKFFNISVKNVFKGDLQIDDRFGLSLSSGCESSVSDEGRDAIIFGEFNQKIGHLNGSSIVYDVSDDLKDETHKYVLSLISTLKTKIFREHWRCP